MNGRPTPPVVADPAAPAGAARAARTNRMLVAYAAGIALFWLCVAAGVAGVVPIGLALAIFAAVAALVLIGFALESAGYL